MEAAKLIPPIPNAEPPEATVIRMVRPSRTLFEHRVPEPTMSDEDYERLLVKIDDDMAAERERQRWPDPERLNDCGKYDYWHELERRMQAGEKLPEDARRFYERFQDTDTFISFKRTDLDLAIENRG